MATGNCDMCGAFIGSGPEAEAPIVAFKYQGYRYTLCPADALTEQELALVARDSIKYDIVTRALVRAGVI